MHANSTRSTVSAVHCMLIRHAAHSLQCTSIPVDVTALHVQAHPLLDAAARGGAAGEDGIIVMTTTSITSCSRPHLRHRYACTPWLTFFCAVCCPHACRVLTYARKRTLQTRFSCAARVCLPFLDHCCAWPCTCAKRCIVSCCNRGLFPGHADTHSPMQRPRWQFENASSLHLKLATFMLTQPPTPCCAMSTLARSSHTV